jgi:hypothetical protein
MPSTHFRNSGVFLTSMRDLSLKTMMPNGGAMLASSSIRMK